MKKDKDFIDTSDDSELRYWSKKFGLTKLGLLNLINMLESNKVEVIKKYFTDRNGPQA